MYSYTYDPATGGLLLNFSPTNFSREPRPVYAPELELLGFDKYWTYDRQSEAPYMWAEANQYFYRGLLVAKLKGGNAFTAPEIIIPEDESGQPVMPEPPGKALRPVDIPAMVAANREVLDVIEQVTVKRIVATYTKYKKRVDCFHVAFSGGKDSCVLLDLVKKALPKGSFVVIFGDTGMEFPDTYEVVRRTQAQCQEENIAFYIAKSHLDPQESWNLFGPPSRVLRWCCSVHKSAPQVLKLREITGKTDYSGLAFVGVRSHESSNRAKYQYENYGKKQRGQYSCLPIIEFTSCEIWMYIYANNIIINDAYKKGNSRVGCVFCPMSVCKADYIKYNIYRENIDNYINIITKLNGRSFDEKSFISQGGWVSRRSGRDLIDNHINYKEYVEKGFLIITVNYPNTDWHEWIKTIENIYDFPYTVTEIDNGYVVKLQERYVNKNPIFRKLFKQVFRKSAYCIQCGVCKANCRSGCLDFNNNYIHIKECTNCLQCHDIEDGCLAFQSLRIPIEEKSMSINCFDSVLPKQDWFINFFTYKDNFWDSHGLGPNQVKTFKRFLKDSELTVKNKCTNLVDIIIDMGWDSSTSWGIILINLSYNNPQIQWYIRSFEVNHIYTRDQVLSMLLDISNNKTISTFIYRAFCKLVELPLGNVLHFGNTSQDGSITRTKCSIDDPRVFLYGLFKFAEKCNNYKEFTLATLMNDSIERDGISPTRIFGLSREDVIPMLLGLSARYSDFIIASFTHDLEKITLAEDKNSQDVLALFQETAHV